MSIGSDGVKEPLLDKEDDLPEERTVIPFHVYTEEEVYPPFPQNVIVTSRYTIISFFPKSLFEQFRRLANVYFLVIGIIAAIGANSDYYNTAVEPEGILLPMTIVVLISVIKDGIEDVK
jgi:hypothetical protein